MRQQSAALPLRSVAWSAMAGAISKMSAVRSLPKNVSGSKPIYLKSTFWRRLPNYHPAILSTAFTTAIRSNRIFRDFPEKSEIFSGSRFQASGVTSGHPFWLNAFKDSRASIEKVLEIGAFEGQTTVFLAWLFPQTQITCIDPWRNYNEVSSGMTDVKAVFDGNTKHFGNRLRAIQGFSSDELPKLLAAGEQFDIIFIDGSHYYGDVVIDSQLSWRLLKLGGVLIWDDYLWRRKDYGKLVPKLAIDQFLSAYKGQYRSLWAFKQVAIRKTAPTPLFERTKPEA
jgi:predicted O-methyltransferase YrrM